MTSLKKPILALLLLTFGAIFSGCSTRTCCLLTCGSYRPR